MDWQTITITGFTFLAIVIVLFFSVKETRAVATADYSTVPAASQAYAVYPEMGGTSFFKEVAMAGSKHGAVELTHNPHEKRARLYGGTGAGTSGALYSFPVVGQF